MGNQANVRISTPLTLGNEELLVTLSDKNTIKIWNLQNNSLPSKLQSELEIFTMQKNHLESLKEQVMDLMPEVPQDLSHSEILSFAKFIIWENFFLKLKKTLPPGVLNKEQLKKSKDSLTNAQANTYEKIKTPDAIRNMDKKVRTLYLSPSSESLLLENPSESSSKLFSYFLGRFVFLSEEVISSLKDNGELNKNLLLFVEYFSEWQKESREQLIALFIKINDTEETMKQSQIAAFQNSFGKKALAK